MSRKYGQKGPGSPPRKKRTRRPVDKNRPSPHWPEGLFTRKCAAPGTKNQPPEDKPVQASEVALADQKASSDKLISPAKTHQATPADQKASSDKMILPAKTFQVTPAEQAAPAPNKPGNKAAVLHAWMDQVADSKDTAEGTGSPPAAGAPGLVVNKAEKSTQTHSTIVDSKDAASKDAASKDAASKDVNSEDVDSEDLYSKDLDSKDVNLLDAASKDAASKDVDSKNANSKDVDSTDAASRTAAASTGSPSAARVPRPVINKGEMDSNEHVVLWLLNKMAEKAEDDGVTVEDKLNEEDQVQEEQVQGTLLDGLLEDDEGLGEAIKPESQESTVSQPAVNFGDDLIWLGD